ncbi:hypothetical protein FA09DRAFT_258973 [Tilletiopsis washingtonensis]|uniref:Uncharacterized protein n=1 Tax=Tilletiopsis washingtonensis TaxID=58919 RepID=A0A316ZBK1_9BASI|nr:hypothetical protein FA09DRAFT_258973 [Tilletiopsis washingtonensis]PWN98919.1 hypothetical protein FA09DRAFT_258973 [Tilletiopsis washingtonensis]
MSASDAHALQALYLEHGWEYLDLGAALEVDAEADEDGEDEDGETEDDGLPRAREALQTHMWPNMQRKEDERRVYQPEESRSERTTSFKAFSAAQEAEDSDKDDAAENESAEIERRAEAFLASLPLPSSDHATSVDAATDKDEELARAFLAQLELSSLANAAGSDMSARELELFLQQSDPHWPSESGAPNGASTSATGRFDDDFSDFVSAGGLASGSAGFDDADLDHLQEPGELRDFTAALAEMQREAARIRALPDPELRHREAERVALTFGDALDRGM